MSRTVFDLEGKVGLEDKNFINKAKRVKQALTDIQNKFKRVSNTSAGLRKPTKEYQALERQVKQAEKAVQDLKKAQAKQAAAHKQSDEYKTLQKDVVRAEAELDKLIEKQISWAESGISPSSAGFQELDRQIERSRSKLEEMKAALAGIAETGATDEEARDWFKTADAIDKAEGELREYKAQQASMLNSGKAFQQTAKRNPFFTGLKSFGKGIASGLGKMIAPQKRVSNGFKNISKQAAKMKKGLFMGAGIKGLARLGVAGALALYSIRALKQGLENLRAYDATTNASINQMSASLATLKNALATAFAPILNVVAPILAQFIDWLTAAVTAIAHFMAALTGQSQVTIARRGISGVGSAASGAADSTNDANDAAKEYQKTLMGFDQINKLEDPTAGSGGSGGGGGGGGGAGGAGSMFETVPVDSLMADWADKIKEAWAKADFYDIGRAVGEKLRDSLQQIPWDDIQAVGAKIGKSIATGLNGFFETPDLGKTIGATIAEALNTIVITVSSFTVNFHWDSLGKFVSESINGFFETFDWKLTGQTMSNLAKGLLDATITAVENVDWRGVGSSIMEMITSIDYVGIATRLITLLGSAISGAADLLSGAIDTLKEKLTNWIESGEIWKDIGSLGSAVLDLTVNILGAAWELLTSIIDLGASVAISLVKSGWTALSTFVGEKVSAAVSLTKSGWTTISGFVGNAVSAAISLTKSGWTSLKDFVGSSIKAAISLSKSGWTSLKGFVGSSVSVGIKLFKSGWKSISSFIGTKVRVGISLFKSGWKSLKKFFGLSGGGILGSYWRALAEGGIQNGSGWKPVTAAAGGGSFAHGQVFVAREAGPEMVGTIGGKTAVMNNNQIVASVAAGVAQAMTEVLRSADLGNNSTTVYLEGDAAKFFRVMQQTAIDYTRATGQPAFPV